MKNILFFVILIYGVTAYSQEVLTGITVNPNIANEYKKPRPKKSKRDDTKSLMLPFFDDFSNSFVYPNNTLWSDSSVFINNSYGVRPVSVGVATFDALNKAGILNEQTNYNTVTTSDYLTSQPINLNPDAPENDPFDPLSIFLSFYYQPQGIADAPEKADSLILEFYSPENDTWYKQWGVAGSDYADFEFVIVQVQGNLFLQDGFRFRFRNNVSLADNSRPSLVGNCDMWNIDYVYLDKGRSAGDNLFRDIAFLGLFNHVLTEYYTMPWTHYLTNPKQFTSNGLQFSYRNSDNVKRLIDSRNCYVQDLNSNEQHFFEGGGFNALPSEAYYMDFDTAYTFPDNNLTTADYQIKAVIQTDDFDYKPNNVYSFNQTFSNYYAYDDGTAEGGYGLRGEGTRNGRVAYRFNNYKTNDTLLAVQMYFNHVKDNASDYYFVLGVWDAVFDEELNTYIPGNELHTQIGLKPVYPDSLNKMVTFELDSVFAVPEIFFIGWQKTNAETINVGWDKNNTSTENLFFNITGYWEQSELDGALMLRPVFKNDKRIVAGIDKFNTADLKIYPNPVSNVLNIDFGAPMNEELLCRIFDINGKLLIKQFVNNTKNSIDVNHLKDGVYLLNISNGHDIFENRRIIVVR